MTAEIHQLIGGSFVNILAIAVIVFYLACLTLTVGRNMVKRWLYLIEIIVVVYILALAIDVEFGSGIIASLRLLRPALITLFLVRGLSLFVDLRRDRIGQSEEL